MEQQTILPTKPLSESPKTQKLGYAPPKATFIPLKLEERLLTCVKEDADDFDCVRSWWSS